jgi:beta-phosphoglucomutase
MIKAILFDFNGVIIDDEALQMRAYMEALKEHDINLTEKDYYSSLGMDDITFVGAAFKRVNRTVTEETIQAVIKRKASLHRGMLEEELPLFPGVVTFIKAASRHYPLGVVSMARREEIAYALERAGLKDLFVVIISAEDVKACKPDPACYNQGLKLLNKGLVTNNQPILSPNQCLVIEDSPPGIRSARSAGMHALGVTNTVSAEELRAAGAEVVTASLADWTIDAVRLLFN